MKFRFFFLALTPFTLASAADEDGERLFTLNVKPIFASKCLSCHGEDPNKLKGDLNMLTREGLLKGGESSSTVLVPGKPEDSLLITAVKWADQDYEMPPKENDRLDEKQIASLEHWIRLGAPWPAQETQDRYVSEERTKERTEAGILVSTSGGLADDWTYRRYKDEDLWAFRPVSKPPLPKQAAHPIDAFIEAKIEKAGFEPAPKASPRELIRRATFDLTGLPPKPDETAAFLASWEDDETKAWDALITRLLDSPRYGERWGQHWLDVARYADTAGFSNDFERSNAWRYRDYVIRSMNNDKPFDQFIMEQIAGDELAPNNPEMIIATGFLRMGNWGTAMIEQHVARQLYLDDVVDNVGKAFLSIPMSCCKCHDHKFDPIPTRDYYSVYASFATTQPAELPAPYLAIENTKDFESEKALVDQLWQLAEDDRKRIVKKQEDAARAWYKANKKKYLTKAERRNLPDGTKPPRHVGLDHVDEGTLKIREQDTRIWTRRKERFKPLAQAVYSGPDYKYNGGKLRKAKKAHSNYEPKSYIFLGGAAEAKGEEVTPGVLSAIPLEADVPSTTEGRRLAVAKWIADAKNPLSTRSIVNRVWHNHFGKGISATPNNFGANGAKPTHPELLDWLTDDFVANGWKFKQLHRRIMRSQTYQQATSHPKMKDLRTEDPNNNLIAYARPRRLTAEEIRDGLLAITGELNPEMGGLPIRPEINMEVALQPRMIQFSIAPAHQPSAKPEQRNRRSVYTYRVRGQADPFLEIFNQPNPNQSCAARDAAAVSPQAFTLLNSDVMTDRSIALALRLEKESNSLEAQLRQAFQLSLGRAPEQTELERLSSYVTEMVAYHNKITPEPIPYPTEVTRSLVEEFSGRPFEYTEHLPTFQDYIPDKKAWDVSAETRALADVCLALFNTNEFIYVY